MRMVLAAIAMAVASPAAAQERAFAPVVEQLVREVIAPSYARFAATASAQASRIGTLCEVPSPESLDAARSGFGALVVAYAGIEPFRFGPARENNRYERLFFWPDRRGRGLRQVQRVIAQEDETATNVATLKKKSVAVQGLLALEFALFGTGSDGLSQAAGFRCDYARTIAEAMAQVGAAMADAWQGPFAATMIEAGPDNPLYRSHAEALSAILQAAATQLELAGTAKIGAVTGDTPAAAKPKRAPLWRSDQTLAMVTANVATVRALLEGGIVSLLADDVLARTALFELSQVDRALGPVMEDERPFVDVIADPEAHKRLRFSTIPLGAAQQLLGERIPAALGLTIGFNALDGD